MHGWCCLGMYRITLVNLPFMEWKIGKLTPNEENHLLEPMKAQTGGFFCYLF